ncbi:MAG: XAC2610-related protein [Parvibaculaceae bacterium]
MKNIGLVGLIFGIAVTSGWTAFAAGSDGPVGDETFEGGFSCDDAASAGAPLICQSTINPSLPQFGIKILRHADAASGASIIDSIEVTRSGETAPFQTIKPVDSNVPANIANNGFEMADLNFDGFLDMRVVRFMPAGPNMPYQNWLWSEQQGKFIANPALDEITSPKFDADGQEINSIWRSSAAEGGADVYTYDGTTPVLIHRETDNVAHGTCTRTFYDRIEDELKKTGTGPCEEGAEPQQ